MKDQTSEDRTLQVLSGSFYEDERPSTPVKIIRVYLASNGTDTITERTSFIQNVYPRLREYCRQQYGVEFQVVDLEWGLSPGYYVPETLKRKEILKCQNESSGPSLVIFLGQKYGKSVLPNVVPADQFEKIRSMLLQHKSRDTRTTFLLDDWYIKDYNNLPPVYVFTEPEGYFTSEEFQNTSLHGQNLPVNVEEVKQELLRLLEKGTRLIQVNNHPSSYTLQPNEYQISELEKTLNVALNTCEQPEDRSLFIQRRIIDLHNYVEEDIASSFVELFYDENEDEVRPCEEAKMKLDVLELKIQNLLGKENIITKDVLWRFNEVISPTHHHEYLFGLCQDLYENLKFQIDSIFPTSTTNLIQQTELCEEVLRHWTRCFDVAGRFYGRLDLLSKLYNYLHTDSNSPFLLHGPSGSGKTKLISRVATEINSLMGPNTISVVRFIGYTVGSSTARQLWLGICHQITLAMGKDSCKIPDEISSLYSYLHKLLSNFPDHHNLVIFLDSIEQLVSESGDLFSWLPKCLPHNVKIIISCHTNASVVIAPLQERTQNSNFCVQIPNLNTDECVVLLNYFLGRWKRTLTSKQILNIRNIFQKCSAPIFVKLLANQLKSHTSFVEIDPFKLSYSIEEALDCLLTSLENNHGKVFVSKCLGYIVASKTGLSDCELEDILSLDDDVLNEVYTEYQPPVRRIPSVKWIFLKYGLEGFLCSFDTDGITVNMFKHACLVEAIKEKYLHTHDAVQKLHSVTADYFLGTWSNLPKPVPQTHQFIFPLAEAERYVISQPLTFHCNGTTRFNKRKYDQLPRHLKGAERMHEMNRIVYFNYEWLYSKMKALSLAHIFEDFALNPSEEAFLVQEALRQARPTIKADIDNLGPELIGRLLPYYSDQDNIRELIKQCEINGLSHCCLVPNLPYFKIPGSPLKSLIQCRVVPECFAFINSDKYLAFKKREDCYMYVHDIVSGKLKDKVFTSNGDLYVSPDGASLVIFDHITEAAIKVHDTLSGDFRGQIILKSCLKDCDSGNIGEIIMSNETLCTYLTSNSSYLCLADLMSCKVEKMIKMDGKIHFCQMSPDYQHVVCNSDNYIHCYNLKTYLENFKVKIDFRPQSIEFCPDLSFAYILDASSPTFVCATWNDYGMDIISKRNVEDQTECLPVDSLRVSKNSKLVLVKNKLVILVYNNTLQELQDKYFRPEEIPQEFKLPKTQYQNVYFTDAQFSQDCKFVLGSILRIVYIWRVGEQCSTSVQAPVGMISTLLVSRESKNFITHCDGIPEVQVWNISAASNKIKTTDKLTSSVKKIEVNANNNLAFVQCHKSDEIGVIDLTSGMLVDLMTHGNNIEDFCITPSGNYILATMLPRISNSSVNIWDTRSRKIIREFGNTVVKCISTHEQEVLYFIAQDDMSYNAPYYLHSVSFDSNVLKEQRHHQALKYLLDNPFITQNDEFLVALSAENYDKDKREHFNIAMCIYNLNSDLKLVCHSPATIPGPHDIGSLVAVKDCPGIQNTVAIFYQPKETEYQNYSSVYATGESCIGICLFDLVSERVTNILDPLSCSVNRNIIARQIFSKDYAFCLTDNNTLVDLATRREIRLRNFSKERLLAVNNSVVVFCDGSILYVYRIASKTIIGKCEVHSTICFLKLCADDHTVLVGCKDGTVTSYTVINNYIDCPKNIISRIPSRHENRQSVTPDEMSRSWDKIDKAENTIYRRPPTARGVTPKDKIHLQRIGPIQHTRPLSACSTNSITNSKTCTIM